MKRSLFMRIRPNLLVVLHLLLLLLLLNNSNSLNNHLNSNSSSKILLMVIMVVMDQITIATCISHNKAILNNPLLVDTVAILVIWVHLKVIPILLLNNLSNLNSNSLVMLTVKCLLNLDSMVINSSNLITCLINSNHKAIGSNSNSNSNQVTYRDSHKINHLSLMINKEEV
jgi:hypothetical protein